MDKSENGEVLFSDGYCTCVVGLGAHCGHVCGLLLQLADYKMNGVKAIPQDVAKTSLKVMSMITLIINFEMAQVIDLDVRWFVISYTLSLL